MAHLLRKLAVIGLIALNSPVHDEPVETAPAPAQTVAKAPASRSRPVGHDLAGAAHGLAAAREAADILANLDPETRGKVLAMVGNSLTHSLRRAP